LKISQLISKYLQENKSLNIEGFGTFTVDNSQLINEVDDKHKTIINPIEYEYKPNIATDLTFIDFTIKETGKIRPLAVADLETYVSLSKQLLNISKPVVIDGVGTLNKVTAGHYEFIPGNYEPPKINTDNEKDKRLRQAKEVNRENEIRYSKEYKERKKVDYKPILTKIFGALTLVAIIGGGVWAVKHFIIDKPTTSTSKTETISKKDTSISPKKDSIIIKANTNLVQMDSLGRIEYKGVIKIADSTNAYERYNGLKNIGQPAVIYRTDSNNFKVAILVKSMPKDTARVADSLHNYFLKDTKYDSFRVTLEN
jgi:hypothetical protein